jgi:hypothetical protein
MVAGSDNFINELLKLNPLQNMIIKEGILNELEKK